MFDSIPIPNIYYHENVIDVRFDLSNEDFVYYALYDDKEHSCKRYEFGDVLVFNLSRLAVELRSRYPKISSRLKIVLFFSDGSYLCHCRLNNFLKDENGDS